MMVSELFQLDWGDDMSKEMSFLNTGNELFEVADKNARDHIDVLTGQITEFVADHDISAFETVLWSGTWNTDRSTITFDYSVHNFDYIEVWTSDGVTKFNPSDDLWRLSKSFATNSAEMMFERADIIVDCEDESVTPVTPDSIPSEETIFGSTELTLRLYKWDWSGDAAEDAETVAVESGDEADLILIKKIVGVKYQTNDEVNDIRVGADGTTYQTAGQAVRTQIQQAMEMSKASGLSDDVKVALLNCFEHVAWTDEHGREYVDALEDALYPPATLVSISADFEQGSAVIYDTDTLDDLKEYLTVTANYDNGQSAVVNTYTLSGNLITGTSIITVAFGGKSANFSVTVTHMVGTVSVVNNLVNATSSNAATSVTEGDSYSASITAASGFTLTGASVTVMMGSTDITSTAYSNGTISVASVTDTLSITVVAVAVTLSSISAVYTQSGTVYNTDSLDSLKDDLVVTASWSDSSTSTVPSADYTLSGTLTVGTSTVTVSYGGKTTTFTVTVTEAVVVNVTYSQGSLGAPNTDANRVSGVITSFLHFDTETLTVTPANGYSVYPYTVYFDENESNAGTRAGANVLYAYCESDSGYVMKANDAVSTQLKVNGKKITNGSAVSTVSWTSSPLVYTYEKSGQYGMSIKGIGFVVRKGDEADITPQEAQSAITITYNQ